MVLWSRSLGVEDLKLPQVLDLPVWKLEEQVWLEWQGLELEDR